jgi:hypothetical protein
VGINGGLTFGCCSGGLFGVGMSSVVRLPSGQHGRGGNGGSHTRTRVLCVLAAVLCIM